MNAHTQLVSAPRSWPEKIAEILTGIDTLNERLKERGNQTDPDTLDLSKKIMRQAAQMLQVSQNGFGNLLGINDTKVVREWFSGHGTPRRGALLHVRSLVERIVAPPMSEEGDGVDTCADALRPHLRQLMAKAVIAGWQEGEVLDAVRKCSLG